MRASVFSILITEKGGAQRQLDFEAAEIGIGRLEDNDLCLPKNNVSKHHARLVFKDERYVIVDQKSTNGTYVNGRRITGPMVVRRGDKIYIGDFILTLAGMAGTDGVAAREFGPLTAGPASTLDPTTPKRPSAITHNRFPAELKRTQPERRKPADPNAKAGPTTPPPVPRPSPSPPPLPRSSNPPSLTATTPQPVLGATVPPQGAAGPTMPAPGFPDLPPSAASEQPPSAATVARSLRVKPRDRQSNPGEPMATRTEQDPVDRSLLEDVDSAQAAALSGLTSPAVLAPSVRLQGALSLLMERLATHMNVARPEESAFPSEQQPVLERLLDQLAEEGTLGPDIDRQYLREAAISEAVGLGPLDRLLANRAVREIVVDGPTRVLADAGGGLTPVSSFFSDDAAVLVTARRLMHRAGQRLEPEQLVHEAQLPNGGAVQVLLPPLSPKGPLIAVRCAIRAQSSPESFVTDGVLSSEMLAHLRSAMQQRKNVLVLGPAGAGVSLVLAMLTRLLPEHERVVAIEQVPSASLLNPQVLPLSRRALPHTGLDELLSRGALLRYDRLLLDDLQPHDIYHALFAAAGSRGALLGLHAPNQEVARSLIEHAARSERTSSGLPGPLVAAALQLLVHVGADSAGARRILGMSELRLTPSGTVELRPLFHHDGKGFVTSGTSFLGS